MYTLKVERSFSAAHSLRGYDGPCSQMHGHNWKVHVYVRSKNLNSLGMVCDFYDIKKTVDEVLAILDHQYINDVAPFDVVNPTSETIAKWLFDEMASKLLALGGKLCRIDICENETSCAIYEPD